ncbi:MAG: SpoIIE family protein phosphatase [Desulfobulbaceae bacterium]|nr:SpoIIE family protein phosphatase [Desulfobulbaceae bacterium]
MQLDDLNQGTNTSDTRIPSRELQLAEFIIENSPAILFRRLAADDPKKRKMVYVSPNFSRFGYRAEDFLTGQIMFRDILFHEDQERTLLEIQSYTKQNIENYTQIYRIITKQGEVRWVEDQTSVIEDATTGTRYHQGIVIDIHERKKAEEELRKSEEKYRRIVETAGEGFLLMDESLKIVDLNSAFEKMVGSRRSKLIGQKPFGADSGQYQQFWTTGQKETDREYREFECEIQSSSQRKVPVLVHANSLRSDTGELIGNMAFVTDMTEHKKALSLAGEVQRSLLPEKAPLLKGLEVAGKNIQCDEVGGDYFDYLWNADLKESEFTVVVGDITGHGVDSALLMSSARAFLRMRASQPGNITNIVTDMNQHMTEDVYETGNFMTLFYLTIGKNRKSVDWIRAGHDPALLYDPELDQFEELKGPGLALGIKKDYVYQLQHRDGLRANQLIILGTDGIWEGSSKSGEMFGKKRFQAIIRRNASKSAENILTTIFQEHADFTKGTKTEDDITLVIVKIV